MKLGREQIKHEQQFIRFITAGVSYKSSATGDFQFVLPSGLFNNNLERSLALGAVKSLTWISQIKTFLSWCFIIKIFSLRNPGDENSRHCEILSAWKHAPRKNTHLLLIKHACFSGACFSRAKISQGLSQVCLLNESRHPDGSSLKMSHCLFFFVEERADWSTPHRSISVTTGFKTSMTITRIMYLKTKIFRRRQILKEGKMKTIQM